MRQYPKLKTGSITQYPASREARYKTRSLRFLDGSEQTYPQQASSQDAAAFTYTSITDGEARLLESLVVESKGRYGEISLENPWTAQPEQGWRLDSDVVDLEWNAEGRVSTRVPLVKEE